jgi:Skp family chaperone for outer membrane proteins
VISNRFRLPLLLTAAFALSVPGGVVLAGPAAAQQSPGWFVPSAGSPAASAPATGHGRHSRTAPSPVATAPLPDPGPAPDAAPDPQDQQVSDAELQQKAANLPQPPAPPLPDIISNFYATVATGDAVKVSASGLGAALPAPLTADATYYLIKSPGLNTVQLASSADAATAGTALTLENAGAGILHLTAPVAHTGAKNVAADFSVALPGTLKLLAGGATPPSAIVGVLGVPDVMRMSSAAQAVDKVIGARKQELQAAIQHAQVTWRELEQGLRADAPKLSREQLLARERSLQDRVNADRHSLQEHQRIIQEAAQVALGQIERTLIGIIRQVSESRGMNLVLHRSQVALNVQEFDITDAVAAQLNRALPTVQIPPADVDPATLPKDWGSPGAAAH